VAGRCNASQDGQDAWDAGDASLASGRNADGSDAGSVFADGPCATHTPDGFPLTIRDDKWCPVLGMNAGGPRTGAGRGLVSENPAP